MSAVQFLPYVHQKGEVLDDQVVPKSVRVLGSHFFDLLRFKQCSKYEIRWRENWYFQL
jgi:hypothetical protein